MSDAAASQSWVERLAAGQLPVLRSTAQAIGAWSRRRDEIHAHTLAEIGAGDPLLCVRMLAAARERAGGRLEHALPSLRAALVLMGIEAFFASAEGAPVLQAALAGQPRALAGALREVARAQLAARIADVFAIHRQDPDIEQLQLAAMVLRLGPLLLWYAAPEQALALAELQAQGRPGAEAERQVLGLSLAALTEGLLRHWALPEPLCRLAGAAPWLELSPGARTVVTAGRIAGHLESGWSHPLLCADLAEAAALLNVSPQAVVAMVRRAQG
jgi:HD-like signal output (HDOD) protein